MLWPVMCFVRSHLSVIVDICTKVVEIPSMCFLDNNDRKADTTYSERDF